MSHPTDGMSRRELAIFVKDKVRFYKEKIEEITDDTKSISSHKLRKKELELIDEELNELAKIIYQIAE